MATPPMELEQVGRRWRVVLSEEINPKYRVISHLMSRKEAEWFMKQLQGPTENAIEEWVEIRTEAEEEEKERIYEYARPIKADWIRKAREEGRVTSPPYQPQMTKKRYEKLLKRQQEEEALREQEIRLRDRRSGEY